MTIKQQIKKILDKLYDAKRADALYAMKDISDWLETDLDAVGRLVDSLPDGYEQTEHNNALEVAKAS